MKVIFFVILMLMQYSPNYSTLLQRLDDFVDDQLFFGFKGFFNTTRKDCVWRDVGTHRRLCPKEVTMELFSNGKQETFDVTDKNWLNKSTVWDREKENVFFIHGYAGGDNTPPKLVLQDALAQSKRFNAFSLEYGPVSRAPCFVQVVYNVHYVSYCIASYIKALVRNGMPPKSIICLGHSIGAHVCGQLKKYLGFRLKKIIGMDPALPLMRESERLSYRDAEMVHTISTNAGFYGDIGSIGHVDVCANNGNTQPFCTSELNTNLCSHLWSLCFTAQSLFSEHPMHAEKCSQVCPHLIAFQFAKRFTKIDRHSNTDLDDQPETIPWGFDIPKSVRGSYCLTAEKPPFCPLNLNGFGSVRCCDLINMFGLV